jgi:hypothetical protein
MTVPAINHPPTPNSVPHPASRATPSGAPAIYEPLMLYGEDAEAQDAIRNRIIATVCPADILEEIWVEDVVDLVWEAFRLRRYKSCLMTTGASNGVHNVLSAFFPYEAAKKMATEWATGKVEHVEKIERILEQVGLTMQHVMAETWAERPEEMERLDRMIASAEERRNTALPEMEHHRAHLASRLRRAADEVEAEFEDAPPGLAAPSGRA